MAVKMRQCRICGSLENLTEHHLVTKSKIRMMTLLENRIPPENQLTVTLCENCHKLFHSHNRLVVEKRKKTDLRRRLRDNLTALEIGYITRVAGADYLRRLYPSGRPDPLGE